MRILIVDDSDFARTGLKMLLVGRPDCEICGEANDGKQAIMNPQSLARDTHLDLHTFPLS